MVHHTLLVEVVVEQHKQVKDKIHLLIKMEEQEQLHLLMEHQQQELVVEAVEVQVQVLPVPLVEAVEQAAEEQEHLHQEVVILLLEQ